MIDPSAPPAPRACGACGGRLGPWITVPSSEPALGPVSYALLRCSACGTAWTSGETPAGLHDAGAYSAGSPRLFALAQPALEAFDRQRLRLLGAAVAPPARVIDAGAGRGRFVLAAQRAGYAADGLEPSERGVRAARESGAAVVQATIESAQVAPGSIDAVSLWHVLEHIEEPSAALARLWSWLRPGGVLLVGVPNLASLQARIGGSRWYHLDVPRHRAHYTPAGLRSLLERSGFTVTLEHHLLLEHNPYGMWQSLVSRFTRQPSYLYNLLKRNAPLLSRDLAVTLLALPLAPAAGVVELAAGLAGHGGTVAVLARRVG